MKLGIISLGGPGGEMVREEASKYFDQVQWINIKNVDVRATSNGLKVLYEGQELIGYDALFMRGSFKYEMLQTAITLALEKKVYMPLHHTAFKVCHNKLTTLMVLQNAGIPVPTTYFAATTEQAKQILEEVNYPIILKIPEGTHGKGVMFADSLPSAKSMLDALEVFKQPYIIQEYIETGATDVRAFVVNGEVVASMRRRGVENELRSNIHVGGVGEKYELSFDAKQIAIKAAKAIKADICGVDLLEGARTVVIEVNASPGFKGITAASNKNVAALVAKGLYEKTLEFKKHQNNTAYKDMLDELKLGERNQKQFLTTLNVKAGIIKLPSIITQITSFKDEEEVHIKADKGRLQIQSYKIRGND